MTAITETKKAKNGDTPHNSLLKMIISRFPLRQKQSASKLSLSLSIAFPRGKVVVKGSRNLSGMILITMRKSHGLKKYDLELNNTHGIDINVLIGAVLDLSMRSIHPPCENHND
jgi:hypothetical protein